MKTLDSLVFFCNKQGRRPKTIFNILKGKQTVSTLFYALDYGMLNYFGFFKNLELNEYLEAFKSAIKHGYLSENDDQVFLTTAGVEQQPTIELPSKFARKVDIEKALMDFLLAIQVMSELSFKNAKYIPIFDDYKTKIWVKQWLLNSKNKYDSSEDLVHSLRIELEEILTLLPENNGNLLINYVPNHSHTELTFAQLSEVTSESDFLINLKLRNTLVELIRIANTNNLELLNNLFVNARSNKLVSDNAVKSYSSALSGATIEEIANYNRLKPSTVKEHILMVAIVLDDFKFDSFIDDRLLCKSEPDMWSFAKLKELEPELTFFEFRLYQIRRIKEITND